jgi:hypothetical protein
VIASISWENGDGVHGKVEARLTGFAQRLLLTCEAQFVPPVDAVRDLDDGKGRASPSIVWSLGLDLEQRVSIFGGSGGEGGGERGALTGT